MNKKIINILTYTGAIGALISAIAYIITVVVLIVGFTTAMDLYQLITFAILGAVSGLLISNLLRAQGVALAQSEPESRQIMQDYLEAKNAKKKPKSLHTIRWHVWTGIIKDIMFKATSVAASTYFAIDVFIKGNGDFGLLGMALTNLLLFICFGLMSLARAYEYYTTEHLAAIKALTKQLKTQPTLVSAKGEKDVN